MRAIRQFFLSLLRFFQGFTEGYVGLAQPLVNTRTKLETCGLCGSPISILLTLQEKMAILHALNNNDLSRRLQFAVNEEITSLEFSEEEIRGVIKALKQALKESQDAKIERYGYFTLVDLKGLVEKIEKSLRIFQVKGA